MSIEVQVATTEAEREAVYRFRYDIYVEEMGRYRATADHDRRRLVEPEDGNGNHVLAVDDRGDVVGVARGSWGERAPSRNVRSGARVLSLSDGHLRRLIDREPRATALLLMNLSRMRCFRLITQV